MCNQRSCLVLYNLCAYIDSSCYVVGIVYYIKSHKMPRGKQGPIAKMLTHGIGIAQEYRADRKARTESEANQADLTEPSDHLQTSKTETGPESEDDEEWAQELDEVQAGEIKPSTTTESEKQTVEELADSFTMLYPPPPYSTLDSRQPLTQPVILPQRRPGERTRGWVRGYAPVLSERGIMQDEWLKFLVGFEKAIGLNNWFHVLNFAVWAADKISVALQGVDPIAQAVAVAIHISLEMSRRGYVHIKQNTYLDKLNDSYFKPRGLYAMVVKYQPKNQSSNPFSSSLGSGQAGQEPIELVDVNRNINEMVEKREADAGKFWKGLLKATAGKTTHEEEMPEFAPLIFPYLDTLSEAEKQSAIKQKGEFLKDYFDRRAQASFAMDHPESKLADVAPRKEWVSEYADPANPKSQGNLISTISGGYLKGPGARLTERRKQRRGRLGIGGDQLPIETRRDKKEKRKNNRPLKRLMRQDALYLMVAEMPTQQEMDAVRQAIEGFADD